MLRIFATIFAALLGLAFGSFLNLCLSRWPQGESVVSPRSHCRHCNRALTWWENIPLASWLALRGRCRTCCASIGWRYPLVELAIGSLWAAACWRFFDSAFRTGSITADFNSAMVNVIARITLSWLLVALAALDAENLWLPDWLTLPGIALGFLFTYLSAAVAANAGSARPAQAQAALGWLLAIVLAAALILIIRWLYWLIRRREGIGLGDAKLMALLAAWLGFWGALLSFCLGVVLGAAVALVLLAVPKDEADSGAWALRKLPLGTFLCIGGLISSLWERHILAAYLRWSGF